MDEVVQAKRFLSRVRFSADQKGPWTTVFAVDHEDAAEMLVFENVRVRNCGGRLPVEVVEPGTADVRSFWVEYAVSFRTSVRDKNQYEPTIEDIQECRLPAQPEKKE